MKNRRLRFTATAQEHVRREKAWWLARHIANLVVGVLQALPQEDRAAAQTELTNQIIRLLAANPTEAARNDDLIEYPALRASTKEAGRAHDALHVHRPCRLRLAQGRPTNQLRVEIAKTNARGFLPAGEGGQRLIGSSGGRAYRDGVAVCLEEHLERPDRDRPRREIWNDCYGGRH